MTYASSFGNGNYAGAVGAGTEFMYPTFVIPDDLDGLFMFNRGS